jgi:predicted double-glycine peptidase
MQLSIKNTLKEPKNCIFILLILHSKKDLDLLDLWMLRINAKRAFKAITNFPNL